MICVTSKKKKILCVNGQTNFWHEWNDFEKIDEFVCVWMTLSVCVKIIDSIDLLFRAPAKVSVPYSNRPACPSVCLSVRLSVGTSVRPSVCLAVYTLMSNPYLRHLLVEFQKKFTDVLTTSRQCVRKSKVKVTRTQFLISYPIPYECIDFQLLSQKCWPNKTIVPRSRSQRSTVTFLYSK